MNQIEHMKKQVRNLMEDLTEDGVRLGVQNPHSKVRSGSGVITNTHMHTHTLTYTP